MKKTYITPQTTIEVIENETMLAASRFELSNGDPQSIETTEDEYDGEFCTKGFGETIFD